MKPAIWLSILIPVYNVEAHLRECMESVLSQIGRDGSVEIVLLNDASTDGSLDIARQISTLHGPDIIRIFVHNCNQGVSAARNRLLKEARGEYVWFIDSDDFLMPGAMSRLRQIVDAYSPDLVLCDYRSGNSSVKTGFRGPRGQLSHDIARLVEGVFVTRHMYCWLKIVRRELFGDDLRFPVGRVFEDMAVIPWLLLRARSYFYEPSAWINYRVWSGSLMTSVNRNASVFDEIKHDQMTQALAGYKQDTAKAFGDDAELSFTLSAYCAIEFTKTGQRLIKARGGAADRATIATNLRTYHDAWQRCSPCSFIDVRREYKRRGRFYRLWQLDRFLKLAQSDGERVR